jgi:uncharacterized membrane protein YfcA
MTQWMYLSVALIVAGAFGGVIAGLLGVGGGIVIVPVLEWTLTLIGVDPSVTLNIAVATSMATIILTSISSARAHSRRDAVDKTVIRSWAPAIVVGAAAGTVVVAHVQSHSLAIVFGCVALAAAIKMLLPLDGVVLRPSVPTGWQWAWLPAVIGFVSALMGIGGGTISVPAMTLCNQPVHRAVGTASMLGLWISVPATVGFLLVRPEMASMPPFTIGYVSLLAFAMIAPTTWLFAPLGARIGHSLSKRALSIAFGVFLLIVAIRMLYRALR